MSCREKDGKEDLKRREKEGGGKAQSEKEKETVLRSEYIEAKEEEQNERMRRTVEREEKE